MRRLLAASYRQMTNWLCCLRFAAKWKSLCQQLDLSDYKSKRELGLLVGDLADAGEGAGCAARRQSASAQLASLEEAERLAALEQARAEQKAALTQSVTWPALAAFIEKYKEKDVGGLLQVARQQLAVVRERDLAAMRATPLDKLSEQYKARKLEPDELRDAAKVHLIEESLRQGTFGGAIRAYQVSDDVNHVAKAQHLAKTKEEKLELERVAVEVTALPERFLDVTFESSVGSPSRQEQKHMGILAQYTMHGSVPVRGSVVVQRAKNPPGPAFTRSLSRRAACRDVMDQAVYPAVNGAGKRR